MRPDSVETKHPPARRHSPARSSPLSLLSLWRPEPLSPSSPSVHPLLRSVDKSFPLTHSPISARVLVVSSCFSSLLIATRLRIHGVNGVCVKPSSPSATLSSQRLASTSPDSTLSSLPLASRASLSQFSLWPPSPPPGYQKLPADSLTHLCRSPCRLRLLLVSSHRCATSNPSSPSATLSSRRLASTSPDSTLSSLPSLPSASRASLSQLSLRPPSPPPSCQKLPTDSLTHLYRSPRRLQLLLVSSHRCASSNPWRQWRLCVTIPNPSLPSLTPSPIFPFRHPLLTATPLDLAGQSYLSPISASSKQTSPNSPFSLPSLPLANRASSTTTLFPFHLP